MKKFIVVFSLMLSPFILYDVINSQTRGKVELTAQEILARVDAIFNYQLGMFKGTMTHIKPDGTSHLINIVARISKSDYLFIFSTFGRGDELRVLYNYSGEDIWVYRIHALKLFHKIGIDKYDPILSTNFYYVDFSNADFQSNYNASITGDAIVKGVDSYRLRLVPIYKGGNYGLLTLYASKKNYVPLRIDYHDPDKAIFKTLSVARTIKKGNKIIPTRYDILDIRKGTVTILTMFGFQSDIRFDKMIFRHQNLSKVK